MKEIKDKTNKSISIWSCRFIRNFLIQKVSLFQQSLMILTELSSCISDRNRFQSLSVSSDLSEWGTNYRQLRFSPPQQLNARQFVTRATGPEDRIKEYRQRATGSEATDFTFRATRKIRIFPHKILNFLNSVSVDILKFRYNNPICVVIHRFTK